MSLHGFTNNTSGKEEQNSFLVVWGENKRQMKFLFLEGCVEISHRNKSSPIKLQRNVPEYSNVSYPLRKLQNYLLLLCHCSKWTRDCINTLAKIAFNPPVLIPDLWLNNNRYSSRSFIASPPHVLDGRACLTKQSSFSVFLMSYLQPLGRNGFFCLCDGESVLEFYIGEPALQHLLHFQNDIYIFLSGI